MLSAEGVDVPVSIRSAVGGAGALLSRCINEVQVIAYPELGPEAVRRLVVEDFPAVVVNDAHGSHTNLLQDQLDPRVTLIRGDLKPYGMMQGLDSSFAAVLFVGFHGKAGSLGGFRAHTGSGRVVDLTVNGVSLGEGGINALFAAWYGVPVAFISGDSLAVDQMRDVTPDVTGVAVKTGIWNRAVRSLSPDSATAAIRRGVAEALRRRHRPAAIQSPFDVELKYATSVSADVAEGIPGVRRVAPTTVGFSVDEYPAAYRMIRLLYKHLRP